MDISAARQARPREWKDRYDDIVRAVETAEEKYRAPPEEPKPQPEPSKLDDVVKVFGEWLALPDPTPLYAMLGTVVANLLPGDPVWLGIIAPPSSAKTELLNSLSRLPYVAVAEALSPAALLSGTPKRQKTKGASGGLLKQIGDFGILAFKDFGTVLEMRIEARAEMLAALRRVFDGEYVRQLGSDGGQTIAWHGKVGLIFGSTQKYDLYHAVIGTLGDRFLLVRVDAAANQFNMCFKHVGKATSTMRDELATAIAGLFAGLPQELPEPGPLSDKEMQQLETTVMLAIRLRAGVERDRIRRDIEAVYDPEGPARLALSLERLFAGLTIIGLQTTRRNADRSAGCLGFNSPLPVQSLRRVDRGLANHPADRDRSRPANVNRPTRSRRSGRPAPRRSRGKRQRSELLAQMRRAALARWSKRTDRAGHSLLPGSPKMSSGGGPEAELAVSV